MSSETAEKYEGMRIFSSRVVDSEMKILSNVLEEISIPQFGEDKVDDRKKYELESWNTVKHRVISLSECISTKGQQWQLASVWVWRNVTKQRNWAMWANRCVDKSGIVLLSVCRLQV